MHFEDLTNSAIQPEQLPVELIPEIRLSQGIRTKLEDCLKKEINSKFKEYVRVGEFNSVVRTSEEGYVYFPNQWFYFASICRKYAQALLEYINFWEAKIKPNFKKCPSETDADYIRLLSGLTDEDFQNFDKFLRQKKLKVNGEDVPYREGKNLFDSKGTRSPSDVFGSIVLGKLQVANVSSGWLGTLIYYLARNPSVYDSLVNEITPQTQKFGSFVKLSSSVKDRARDIVKYIYEKDKFEKLSPYFVNQNDYIKVDVEKILKGSMIENQARSMNLLRSFFAKSSSANYNNDRRVFTDEEYDCSSVPGFQKCRLTNQWKGPADTQSDGNSLEALVQVVNKCYSDKLRIKKFSSGYYLFSKSEFNDKVFDASFQNSFAKRYITSLLAKPFVILSGNSGTGKTRIAVQFARYLEKTFDDAAAGDTAKKNWLLVPVGADWTDNTKILGYFNPLANDNKGEYVKTDIFRLIQSANAHPTIPHFLILDEMNLSHVERYFSDFLSHMECPSSSFKFDGAVSEMKFPQNLFITGTVNVDETTYMFSPKVLDRANVIEFKPDLKLVLQEMVSPLPSSEIQPHQDEMAEKFLSLAKKIQSDDSSCAQHLKEAEEVFSKFLDIVKGSDFELGFRTAKEMRRYICAAYSLRTSLDSSNLNVIIDEQILQKFLPKIHGNRKEIGNLLNHLAEFCQEQNLQESKRKIEQMQKRLDQVQFVSFM